REHDGHGAQPQGGEDRPGEQPRAGPRGGARPQRRAGVDPGDQQEAEQAPPRQAGDHPQRRPEGRRRPEEEVKAGHGGGGAIMDQASRHLRADKLIDTADDLADRVMERFPDAGLAYVARTVAAVVREAADKAEHIQRPNWWLRGALIVLAVLVLGGGVAVALD